MATLFLAVLSAGYVGDSPFFAKLLRASRSNPQCSSLHDGQSEHPDSLQQRMEQKIGVGVSGVVVPTALPRLLADREAKRHSESIVIIGGGVSGIYAALTLVELGYRNVTILEKELRVGGKAASFEFAGKKFPLGAVGTPLALESASFTESQLFERPWAFARSLLGRTGRRLQVLNANNLMHASAPWPIPFPAKELKSQVPVQDWKGAFGASGAPERFYPHMIDFKAPQTAELASAQPVTKLVPRWGSPSTSWPLVYVSAHGYGVAQARDVPPYYYWARFAQKATNAGAAGPLGMNGPLGKSPIGPRGPALRGWDSSSLFERKLFERGVKVRTGATVSSITRSKEHVTVSTADGAHSQYDRLIIASDLKASLQYLDADAEERSLFNSIIHQPYYTITSFISLPWLATGSVYYLGDNQAPTSGADAADAGRATAGCPTILLKANKGTNLTISWAYGGAGIGPPQMEACLRRTVERMGGRFNGVQFIKPWHDYFPHVTREDLQANYHKRLDALQGLKRTHLVGEIFNLPLVSECVDFARYLIRREFGGRGRSSGRGGGALSTSPSAAETSRSLPSGSAVPA